MKICAKCKNEKKIEEFQKEKRKFDGFSARCKICLNNDKKEYLDTKREKIREYNRKKYYEDHEKNKKKRTENSKNLRLKNNEWIINYKKNWYKKHAIRLREESKNTAKKIDRKEKRNKKLRENKKSVDLPKIRARKILQAAAKSGFLTRPSECQICKKECKPDGHHDDYNKPLEVRWLCRICHAHQHNKLMDIIP